MKTVNTRLYEICFQVGNLFVNTKMTENSTYVLEKNCLVQIKSEKIQGPQAIVLLQHYVDVYN